MPYRKQVRCVYANTLKRRIQAYKDVSDDICALQFMHTYFYGRVMYNIKVLSAHDVRTCTACTQRNTFPGFEEVLTQHTPKNIIEMFMWNTRTPGTMVDSTLSLYWMYINYTRNAVCIILPRQVMQHCYCIVNYVRIVRYVCHSTFPEVSHTL